MACKLSSSQPPSWFHIVGELTQMCWDKNISCTLVQTNQDSAISIADKLGLGSKTGPDTHHNLSEDGSTVTSDSDSSQESKSDYKVRKKTAINTQVLLRDLSEVDKFATKTLGMTTRSRSKASSSHRHV